jgi:fructokinase
MFIVAGESLIDMVAAADGTFSPVPGGAPYNFARALALQGVPAGYANPFSDDLFGSLLKKTLEESGARHLGARSSKPTSLALVATDERGQPQYSFYRSQVADRDIDAQALLGPAQPDMIGFHSGGLGLVPPDHVLIVQAMQKFRDTGALCTVDINMRPQVAHTMAVAPEDYRQAALAVASLAHVAKVSDEDLQHLALPGVPQVSARALLQGGCKLVILTLGAKGAWAISAEEEIFQAAAHVKVVDTVGAGDCFFAGLIASLKHQGALRALSHCAPSGVVLAQALRHANACAAIDIGRKGCQPATWEEAVAWRPA